MLSNMKLEHQPPQKNFGAATARTCLFLSSFNTPVKAGSRNERGV